MGGSVRGQPGARGPTGLAGTSKPQEQTWFRTRDWYQPGLGEVHCASVYFRTNEHVLDTDDQKELAKLTVIMQRFLDDGHKVHFRLEGRADVRYREDYNLALSDRRAGEVARFLEVQLKKNPRCRIAFKGVGERHSSSLKEHWAEDRRVDVHVRIEFTREESPYKFDKWANNQNLLRPYLFKKYYPLYWHWRRRGLEYLVDQYERESGVGSGSVVIRPADYDKVMEVIVALADYDDSLKIKEWAKANKKEAVTTAYGVEYRKAYDVAYRRAYEAFRRSDFRYPWEFFAIEFGLVPRDTPYTKRPGAGSGETMSDQYQYGGQRKH